MPEARLRPGQPVLGWDVGGAHVKAALLRDGTVQDVMQWPCPLWQGLTHLDTVLDHAAKRWGPLTDAHHVVTMTGEMADLFADRADGVRQIAQAMQGRLGECTFYAGEQGWCSAPQAAQAWAHIASANWLATAQVTARLWPGHRGMLVDIGSTTTDLIAFGHGRVLCHGRSDAQRLARSELVYHGVVRTPLCALARQIAWQGQTLNVMNEFFATTADVYRTTGELDAAHDQQPSADGRAKDAAATHARLARMVGLDARDGSPADWQAFAQAWRAAQVEELRGQFARVASAQGLGPGAVAVAAGCGRFLVPDLAGPGWTVRDWARDLVPSAAPSAQAAPGLPAWAGVAAAAVAVALIYHGEQA